ncbi:MAG: type II toxin-antitoxin system ParD family antitoxin [Bryocella sp.]
MPDIEKVSVALTGEQVSLLKAAVESGEYATTSEAIREALREWNWKRELREREIDRVRKLWDEGLASGTSTLTSGENLAIARTRVRKKGEKAA